jgi:hypothetical protein
MKIIQDDIGVIVRRAGCGGIQAAPAIVFALWLLALAAAALVPVLLAAAALLALLGCLAVVLVPAAILVCALNARFRQHRMDEVAAAAPGLAMAELARRLLVLWDRWTSARPPQEPQA